MFKKVLVFTLVFIFISVFSSNTFSGINGVSAYVGGVMIDYTVQTGGSYLSSYVEWEVGAWGSSLPGGGIAYARAYIERNNVLLSEVIVSVEHYDGFDQEDDWGYADHGYFYLYTEAMILFEMAPGYAEAEAYAFIYW